MAATRPQQNLAADCILAAHAAVGLAAVTLKQPVQDRPAREFSRMLATAAQNWPGKLTPADQRILWAVPQAAGMGSTAKEAAQLALIWSQRIESGVKAELPLDDVREAKMFCLRMSDALGLKSKSLRF